MAADSTQNLLEKARPRITAVSATALTVALVALGATVLLGVALVGTGPMFRSLLIGFVLPFGLAIGSLVLLMIQWCTAGYWGYVMRRPLEAGTRTIPLMALVFALIAAGGLSPLFDMRADNHPENHHPELNAVSTHTLWPWADKDLHLEHHEELVLEAKKGYLNAPFFAVRAAIAFVVWIALALALNRVARREDAEGTSQKLRDLGMQFSGPGIVLYAITMLFVSTDWSMSLQPVWYSSMFPVIFGFGQLLSAMCFNGLLFVFLRSGNEDLSTGRNKKVMRDLGSFMLGFVVFWTYISFSQYLLIWSANLKEEVPFFIARTTGGWQILTAILAFGHFVFPFFILLLRDVSRSGKWLARVAGFILVMRFIDIYWQMKPAFRPGEWNFFSLETVMDLAAAVGLFALWLAFFLRQLGKYDLLPANDNRKETEPVHTVSDDVEIAASHG